MTTIFDESGPLIYNDRLGQFMSLESINNKIKELIDSGGKITIREFYRDILGCFDMSSVECFVDPDEWGWDKQGFRQLYCYSIERKEL